ncbi:antitoxin Xre/MbcA/ParS toxin-binding domain-containing protein [Falsiroseomonas sp.]|uniref:antitoxin Xre/MbcA/ParS toxin-binding domain-containing protein n=1 Tax=Falsiroseomonas sp. TaxID=2870721 RepID=UPI003F70E290
MLANYDAKAVAEILGIAFRREAPAGRGDFVIRLGEETLRVVQAGAERDRAPSPSAALIEKAVARGLPRQALRHVAETLAGGDKARATSLEFGVVPKTTLDRRATQLSPQESERTERVARLFVHARRALGTEAEARDFMTTPHPALEGRSPVDAARTDLGTRRTEAVLNALEYGLAL